nr:hypothetical protein [Tanacetum cinerariifolium]
MEEYIRLEEEKARRHGKVYNWETTKYGKIWYDDDDAHDLRSVESEFPTTVFNDELTSEEALPCEPKVSSLNDNEIDFRISFDESNDEYYMVIFDKNSFSYKIISVNDLKADSENDNEKVNMPSFPSHEPTISCFDDLEFFIDFENEFPSIVYNDALTSKSDSLTEPTLSPQHIEEFDLKDKTSLSEYDKVEQNILYFNDLFPFNIIYPDNLNLDKDNDDNEIDIIYSLGDMALPPRDQRYQYLRYEGLQYTDADTIDFKTRLGKIYRGELGGVRHHMGWREFILAMGLHTGDKIESVGFGAYWAESASQIPDKGNLGMDVSSVNVSYLLARYLRLFASGKKHGAMISRELPVIDMVEFARMQICEEMDDILAWVAPGPERQQVATAGVTPLFVKKTLCHNLGVISKHS